MAKLNDYPEVASADNLPESAMLVIEFGSNGGTKKISGKKFVEDLSNRIEYIAYDGYISTHPDFASTKAIYFGLVNTEEEVSGYAKTVVIESSDLQSRIAMFMSGKLFYQQRRKINGVWQGWGDWAPVSVTIPDNSISEEQLKTALRNKINNVYTKQEVDSRIASVAGLSFKVVSQLPTTDISSSTIYLVPSGTAYQKWVYVDNDWVNLGSSDIDMSSKVDKTTQIAGVQINTGITSDALRAGLNMPRVFRWDHDSAVSADISPETTTISQSSMMSLFGTKGRVNDLLVQIYTNYRQILICETADDSNAVFVRADNGYAKVDRSTLIAGLQIGTGIDKADLQQALRVNEAVYLYTYSLVGSIPDEEKSLPISWISAQHPDHSIAVGDLLYGIYYKYLYVCYRVTSTNAIFTPIYKAINADNLVQTSTQIAGVQIGSGIKKVALSNSLRIPRMWHTFSPFIDGEAYSRYGEKFVPRSALQVGNTDVHTDDEQVDYEVQDTDLVYSMATPSEGLYMVEVMGGDVIEIDGNQVQGYWLEPISVANGSIGVNQLASNIRGYFTEATPVFCDEVHAFTDPTTGKRRYVTNYPLNTYNTHSHQQMVLIEPNFIGGGVRRERYFFVTKIDADMVNRKINRIEATATTVDDKGFLLTETILFERTNDTQDTDPVYFDVVDNTDSLGTIVVQLTPDYDENNNLVGYTSNLSRDKAVRCIRDGRAMLLVASINHGSAQVPHFQGEYFKVTTANEYSAYNSVLMNAVNLSDIYEGVIYYKVLEGHVDDGYIYFDIVEDTQIDIGGEVPIENGDVYVATPEHYSGSDHTMFGTYQLVAEYCTVTATAKVVAGWHYTYYRLPVVPLSDVMTFIFVGSTEYAIKTDTTNGYNCVNIYRVDGQNNTNDDNVSFTIMYRYSDDYSMHQGYTQAEVNAMIQNREAEIEQALAEL